MDNNIKTLIDATPEEAKTFFMRADCYCNFALPKYFTFDAILKKSSEILENVTSLSQIWNDKPKKFEDVNYQIIKGKSEKYAWRQLQLINPIIYADLVNQITQNENWNLIINRLKHFYTNSKTICTSFPVISFKGRLASVEQINQYYLQFEQKSVEMSLKYEHILLTDITNCYPSIYTHTIPWAIHSKEMAKKEKDNGVGNFIDKAIQSMSNGQTNGLPQGSVLMDFIAEIVLAYVDALVTKEISNLGLNIDYQILRYRDDYRIFVKNSTDADTILKILSDKLYELNLRLNVSKTITSNDIIRYSYKMDKFEYIITDKSIIEQQNKLMSIIENESINKGTREILQNLLCISPTDLEIDLLKIYNFSKKYPNSGTIKTLLTSYARKIDSLDHIYNVNTIIAIISEIIISNPDTYSIATGILSKCINSLADISEKKQMIQVLESKFKNIPYTEYMDIWLQRISYFIDKTHTYKSKICQLLTTSNISLWNFDWLQSKYKELLTSTSLLDYEALKTLTPVIPPDELDIFSIWNY